MDKTAIPIPTKKFKVIDMSDGIVIQKDDILHTLNATACEIFELCDGKHNMLKIIDEMKIKYPNEDIDKLIEDFIEQLRSAELIDI